MVDFVFKNDPTLYYFSCALWQGDFDTCPSRSEIFAA
jgi:hypothetical protein